MSETGKSIFADVFMETSPGPVHFRHHGWSLLEELGVR